MINRTIKLGRYIAPLLFTLSIALAFTLSPGLRAGAQSWVGGFLRDTNGYLEVNCSNCSGGGVASVAATDASITVSGTATNPTVAVNQAFPFNLSAALQDTSPINAVGVGGANACSGTKLPSTFYGMCFGSNNGATNIFAAVIGPQQSDFACTATCTSSDSARLAFYDSLSTGAAQACNQWYARTTNPSAMDFSCSIRAANYISSQQGFIGGNGTACTGTGTFTGPANSGQSQCQITLATGTATWTYASAWTTAPLCVGTDTTAANPVKITTTATTATVTGTSSDVINVICMGNGKP